MSLLKRVSFVDSTIRLKWELTKEDFDSCEYQESIDSDRYIVGFGTETSEWYLTIYPKGDKELKRNQVAVYIEVIKADKAYDVLFGFGVETETGYWPNGDLAEKLYSRRGVDYNYYFRTFDLDETDNWGEYLCSTEDFAQQFVQNKVTLVATLVFHMEDSKRYYHKREVADAYTEDVRSLPLQENLSDITVICGEKQFPSHRALLAARSKYFEALFRNEPQKKEVKIEEASPEIVAAMVDFMSKGLIPVDIDEKARDLVMLADMYGVELLIKICLTSMVNTLSPDNVLDALITVDKLEHVAKAVQRNKILAFIGKEATQIVKAENWEMFVQTYPSLVSDIVLAAYRTKA